VLFYAEHKALNKNLYSKIRLTEDTDQIFGEKLKKNE